MRNVLADMQVESEAATTLAMRVARAFDDACVPRGCLASPAAGADKARR